MCCGKESYLFSVARLSPLQLFFPTIEIGFSKGHQTLSVSKDGGSICSRRPAFGFRHLAKEKKGEGGFATKPLSWYSLESGERK